ncbi:mastermind-like domain-containing protein 1 [Aplysia californica]|uniref:Mastermind-like domain-containing protein 1 n=1 Tax=Aplysia californica TaxID=6500 RepID=A0ABM0ZYF4_APLCA|nr:mastermind-like domain-containing protein 1 [Aplysia californica]
MMEVDSPSSSSPSPVQNGTSLKRSNSAPMINLLVTSQPDASPPSMFKVTNSTALRRLSSSNMSLHNAPAASTSPPIRGTDRVARLKQEEIHIADRERQHEREIQSSFWISNNWGRLTFDSSEPMEGQSRRPRSYSESLHIMTQSNILCGSPSPTRAGIKQCFSPSMQIPVKNTTFTPSPSPSPTRKNFLRSLSPIAVRTGPLKRKLDQEGDRWEYISPPKKFHTGPSTPDRMMGCSHPLAHSISSSSLEGTGLDQVSVRPHNGSSGLTTVMSLAGRSPLAGHSPLSSCSGAPSPHTSLAGDSGGGLLGPGKPSFLFRPVAESVLGSPSSTSSSSSSSTSSSSLHLMTSLPDHPHHHAHHQQQPQQQQPQQQQHHHSQPQQQQQQHQQHHHQQQHQALERGSLTQPRGLTLASQTSRLTRHGDQRMSSDASPHHDVYMSDSEMGDQCEVGGSNKPAVVQAGGGFNFKPISPDHA